MTISSFAIPQKYQNGVNVLLARGKFKSETITYFIKVKWNIVSVARGFVIFRFFMKGYENSVDG